ncbi:MAG: AAA domain-containing protein [bacterium]|nr:AAA domain-containing protein [bacterium]
MHPVLGSYQNWARIASLLLGRPGDVPRVDLALPRYRPRAKSRLNPSQRDAIERALSNAPLTLIEGPPGTGKTTVITEIIRWCILHDRRVLCISPTHLAVDNVIERLEREALPFFPYRIGTGSKVGAVQFTHELRFETILEQVREKRLNSATLTHHPVQRGQAGRLAAFSTVDQLSRLLALADASGGDLETLAASMARTFEALVGRLSETRRLLLAAEVLDTIPYLRAKQAEAERFQRLDAEGVKELASVLEASGAAPIFGTTLGFLQARDLVRPDYGEVPFDVLIVDEASKLTLSHFLPGALRARKIVLVGDSQQLPPFQNEQELKTFREQGIPPELLDRSIFTFLEQHALPSFRTGLNIQYRMHPGIARYSNLTFYGGRVRNGRFDSVNPIGGTGRIIWYDDTGHPERMGTSWQNREHLRSIRSILKSLQESPARNGRPLSVGIIAMYGAQASLIGRELDQFRISYPDLTMEAGTVDGFQGKEADVVIVDLVRKEPRTGVLNFINNPERLNVAFTRARDLLFVVGDRKTFQKPRYHVSPLFADPDLDIQRHTVGS